MEGRQEKVLHLGVGPLICPQLVPVLPEEGQSFETMSRNIYGDEAELHCAFSETA